MEAILLKALELHVNDELLLTAGVGDDGALSAHLVWSGIPFAGKVRLHILGFDADTREQLDWPTPRLGEGDRITIRVVGVAPDAVDEPTRRQARTVLTPDGVPQEIILDEMAGPVHITASPGAAHCSFCGRAITDPASAFAGTNQAAICHECAAKYGRMLLGSTSDSRGQSVPDSSSNPITDPGRRRK